MAKIDKVIGYVMAPPQSRYEGEVMRRVTTNLAGVQVTLSETTTGATFEEFMLANPTIPVDGRSALSLSDDVSRMTNEQLDKLGLVRKAGVEQQPEFVKEEEDLSVHFTFPVHEGFGVYRFSDDTRGKMKKPAALAKQALLDAEAE